MPGWLLVQGVVSLGVVRHFLTSGRNAFHWWRTLVAPVLGGGGMFRSAWLLVSNRDVLAAARGQWFLELFPWFVGALFVAGVGAGADHCLSLTRPT